jgi:hypothetical protein
MSGNDVLGDSYSDAFLPNDGSESAECTGVDGAFKTLMAQWI